MSKRGAVKATPDRKANRAPASQPVAAPLKPSIVRRRAVVLAIAGVVLVAAAAVVRLRAGDRDSQLASMTTDELAAMAHLYPTDAAAHYHLAQHLAAETRYAAAKNQYEEAIRLDPSFAPAQVGLGNTYAAMGMNDAAASALQQALHIDSQSAAAEFALARVLKSQGRAAESLAHMQRATKLDPGSDQAWYECALSCINTSQDDAAADCLRHAISIHENSPKYHTTLAEVLARMGRLQEAWKQYQRALELDPNYGEACALAGKFLVSNPPDSDAPRRAEDLLTRATRTTSSHPSEVYFDLGQLYLSSGRGQEAIEALKRAIEIEPRDERFYYALATAYRRNHDAEKAKWAESKFRGISALHQRMEHLDQVTQQDPSDSKDRLALARVCRDLGLLPLAVRHYSSYIRLVPQDAAARRELDALTNSLSGTSSMPGPAAHGSR